MKGWSFLTLVLVVNHALAQQQNLNELARSNYVERFNHYYFVWPVVKQRSTSFDLENIHNSHQKITYQPNVNFHAGLGAYLFGVGFQLVLALPTTATSNQNLGKSNALDLQANALGKNWAADIFTQNYQGYYLVDATRPVPASAVHFHRNDIRTTNTGINGSYFFNRRSFSIRSTFNYYERQLKSAGSFILSGNLNTFSLQADSAIYGKSYETYFGSASNFSSLHFTTLAIAPGYAYNLVVRRSWFAGVALSVGPGLNWLYYEQGAAEGKSVVKINTYVDFRLSAGYNGERFFAGITYLRQDRNIQYEQVLLTNSNNVIKAAIGYRFNQKGILKRKAIEFLRPKTSG